VTPPPSRHDELAHFLRTRRARVTPVSAGVPVTGRRRTPGLRREEVAQLAGVGLSWYTWLEQGRDIRPSPQVLNAIARALRLDGAERAHLFHLARTELPAASETYPREAPAGLRAFVEALSPHPAYVTGPLTDVLAWNRQAAVVIHDFGAMPSERRSLLWWLFADPALREAPTWEDTAKRTLARFRAEHARRVGDPAFARLVEELSAASPEFRNWWPRHEVLAAQSGTKTISHPEHGTVRMHHLQSVPTSSPDLRLTVYAPADETTRAAFAAL
jgi:transcriptional regulator with XRE-family HTH domain